MKPRILIDASVVTDIPDGLSIYVINLLRHMPDSAFDEFDFSLLTLPGIYRDDLRSAVAGRPFRLIEEKVAPLGPRRDWDMYRFMKRYGREFDLTHITSVGYPMLMRGGVWTVHDVTFKRWFHNPRDIPGAGRIAVAYLSAMVRAGFRRAQKVIVVSESTREEIKTLFSPPAEQMAKIVPIHQGWEHLADYRPQACEGFRPSEAGYLFFLGSYRLHKNLARLLEAFERAIDRIPPGKQLVISGGSAKLSGAMKDRIDRLNANGERVRFTGFLSNDCVGRYYQGADAFLFPSLAEGFGIPALEAFYYETPLLCSNVTAVPEVAGDAAFYFDPFDVDSIADAIVRFYREPETAAELVRRGQARLKLFSWRKTAEETLDVYRKALAERS
jgi:glycosyltransferase involved in cell wall biosynthesis